MPKRVPPIARIRLARSMPRLLVVPIVVGLAGGASVAAGLLLVGALPGYALVALGAVLVLGALIGSIVLLSIRLEVEESAVRVSWLGGERTYPLTPGPVTRVRFRGENASRIRARSGALGWGFGRARLRGEEDVELVRLAPTPTAILIPTERGRLAVAPARDDDLLDALSRAARARQRLDALAEAEPAGEPEPLESLGPTEPPPTALTGIQRALLEERLANERAAAEAAAEALRTAAALPLPTALPPEPPVAAAAVPRRRRPSLPRPQMRLPGGVSLRPRPGLAFVLLPLAGAGLAWAAGTEFGTMPPPGSDLARLTSLALVLAGPATSVGAIMALAWWPRMVGVVVAGGLATSVFIGRSLIGA